MADEASFGKLTTEALYSNEVEEALIGCILIEPETISKIDIMPIDFYLHHHQWIWRAINDLTQAGSSIDNITLANKLESEGKLAEVGGSAYLAQLVGQGAEYYNARDYAEIVKTFANKRKILNIANTLAKQVYSKDGKSGLNAVIDELEKIKQVVENRTSDPWQAFTLVDAYQERPPVEHIAANLFALPSLNIVYGSPGTLKSFLLADLSICAASGLDWLPPAPWVQGNLAQAINTLQCSVMWLDFDNGQRRTHDRLAALARARHLPTDTPIVYYSMPYPWLDATDNDNISALSLRIQARDCKLVVVDNLGVVSGGAEENNSEMIQVMSLFRQLAEETGAAIVLIHHQRKSNGTTSRVGDTMRGHSSIESALDLALLVEREELSDTISIKGTKVRGNDVLPFSAVFTYVDDPNDELVTAKFFGTASEDMQSNQAIKREIKSTLCGATMNKTDLAKNVKGTLDTVGVNRIRDQIDRMEKAGELRVTSGSRTERRYSLQ